VARGTELVGLVHDEERQRRRNDVANRRNESNQRIKAEAHAREGDDKRAIQEGRKRVDPGDTGAARAGAHKVEAESVREGHGRLSSAGRNGDTDQRAQ
jgi:hypothetical protein